MLKTEFERYNFLNELAEAKGIVVFGGSDDMQIPLCELKQSFAFDERLYNRSFSEILLKDAIKAFDACIAPIMPETVLLHLGEKDLEQFVPEEFDRCYIELIRHIKGSDKYCNIAIISMKDSDSPITAEMNRHLKHIAQSERCEFFDISEKRVWNPKETKSVVSFVYSLGFVHPLNCKRPIFDLIKILFCYEPIKV